MYVRMPSSPGSRAIAGVPSSTSELLITAPPSVCVPAVLGALVVWIHKQNQTKLMYLARYLCGGIPKTKKMFKAPENCLVASLQELIPHKTFLSLCVVHPHGGYRATSSALVFSSHDFGFTHTTSFSNHNRRDQFQHSLSLDHPTSLFFIEPLSHPYPSVDTPTTPPLLFTIPFRFQTTTQPLPIPRQPPFENPTIHLIPTPHFHTTNHPTTHIPWFL